MSATQIRNGYSALVLVESAHDPGLENLSLSRGKWHKRTCGAALKTACPIFLNQKCGKNGWALVAPFENGLLEFFQLHLFGLVIIHASLAAMFGFLQNGADGNGYYRSVSQRVLGLERPNLLAQLKSVHFRHLVIG